MADDKHKNPDCRRWRGRLELATELGQKLGQRGLAEVTLPDAVPTHIWKPLLHEVASTLPRRRNRVSGASASQSFPFFVWAHGRPESRGEGNHRQPDYQ